MGTPNMRLSLFDDILLSIFDCQSCHERTHSKHVNTQQEHSKTNVNHNNMKCYLSFSIKRKTDISLM